MVKQEGGLVCPWIRGPFNDPLLVWLDVAIQSECSGRTASESSERLSCEGLAQMYAVAIDPIAPRRTAVGIPRSDGTARVAGSVSTLQDRGRRPARWDPWAAFVGSTG